MTKNELKANINIIGNLSEEIMFRISAASFLLQEHPEQKEIIQKLLANAFGAILTDGRTDIEDVAQELCDALDDNGVLLEDGPVLTPPLLEYASPYEAKLYLPANDDHYLIAEAKHEPGEFFEAGVMYQIDNHAYDLSYAEIKKGNYAECNRLPRDNQKIELHSVTHDDRIVEKVTIDPQNYIE